jgi:hypothetical protein
LVKKETIKEDLSATEEVIANHHQDLREEMTAEVRLVKKTVNPSHLKISLEVLKRSLLKISLKSLIFN